jgi:CheY-like chemotaxis protein/nitrogen-specific signal transduction histidine kinase
MARALLTFREAAVAKAALERETLDLAQQAQAANRAKSAFLATMAHELRTPLNGILGMAQIMAGHTLSGDQQDRLGVIRSSGQTLLGVINDVLDVSQIEAGRLEIQAAPFDLGRFCDELGALYGALAAEKGLAFSLRAAPASRVWLLGDVVRLRQIAGNLISNALKFTAAGAITVTVDHADGRLSFACADTGVGVPEDRQAQLFERFVQADASLTRRFGGSGLGLAICRDLLTLMGGQIGFESRPGHGSTFHFAAPMPLAPALEAAPAVASPQADPVDSGLRVLVADDNATNRLVIGSLLDRFMIASESVENGRQAVEAWEAGTFDAILMDIHMPEMDGVAATAAIRRRERETGRPKVPIIAVTASVLAHETEGYIAAGMDGCVAKPIDAQTMLTTLQDLLAA